MKLYAIPVLWVAIVVAALLFVYLHPDGPHAFTNFIRDAHHFGQVLYVLLLVSVGIYLPLNAIPLIPFGAALFGPLEGALLSSFGWTAGAVGSFWISRFYGRPFVEQYMSLEKLDTLLARIPERNKLLGLLLFRLVLPSDTASYALGLAKSLDFKHYLFATAVSYTTYSFLLSYLGHALFEGRHILALKAGLGLLAIFGIGWYLLNRLRN